MKKETLIDYKNTDRKKKDRQVTFDWMLLVFLSAVIVLLAFIISK